MTQLQWYIIGLFLFVNIGSLVTVWGFFYSGFKRKFKEDVLADYMERAQLKKEYYSKGEMYDKFVSIKQLELTLQPFTECMRKDMNELKRKMDALQESNLRFLEIQAGKDHAV